MTLLLLAVLSAAPDSAPIAVVVVSKRPGTERDADELVSLVYLALIDAGVRRDQVLLELQADSRTGGDAFSRARQCEGRTLCLRGLAARLGPGAVVIGVDVGRVLTEMAVHVQAVSDGGPPLADLDFSADAASWRARLRTAVPEFARSVAASRRPGPTPVLALTEAPAPAVDAVPAAAVTETHARPLPAALKWSVAGVSAASWVASGVVLGVALSGKASYDRARGGVDGMPGTTLTDAEARQLASQVNLQLSFALGTALLGAALAAVAAWLFVRG